jgi:hypothetical protein
MVRENYQGGDSEVLKDKKETSYRSTGRENVNMYLFI